jgi:alcohol dehydrogenase YqhD (iron-dependent ADH family)
MINFIFQLPTKIIFGPGQVKEIGKEAKRIGKKALLVSGKSSMRRLGILDKVIKLLKEQKVEVIVFDKIEPNPRHSTVDEGGKLARYEKCDMIIGLGGGSAMDAAKAIAIVAKEEGSIWEFTPVEGLSLRKITQALPIILIPTIAATGSEADHITVITNPEKKEKVAIRSKHIFPKISIVDPELTVSVPPDITGDGGIDIICHVLETYLSSKDLNTPLQDRFTEGIIKTVMENLPKAMLNGNDIQARTNLSWASTLALSGFPNSGRPGFFVLHAIEHPLSAHYDISHGRGLAALLPSYMKFMSHLNPKKLALFAKNIFGLNSSKGEKELALQAFKKMESWMKHMRVYYRLSQLGVEKSHLKKLASDAIRISGGKKGYLGDFEELNEKGIMKILEDAL